MDHAPGALLLAAGVGYIAWLTPRLAIPLTLSPAAFLLLSRLLQ